MQDTYGAPSGGTASNSFVSSRQVRTSTGNVNQSEVKMRRCFVSTAADVEITQRCAAIVPHDRKWL